MERESMDYTYDYVNGTDVYVYQRKDMFRINTDTALLAKFMNIKEGEHVVDIGTNNGALLLCAARFQPRLMTGIEIQKEAYDVACMNMEKHGIENVTLLNQDVKEVELSDVDVIVCNPPYFATGSEAHKNEKEALRIARHEEYLTLACLCEKSAGFLRDGGRLYLVHRSERICEIIRSLSDEGLEVKTLQFVYDENKESARSVLVEAVKGAKQQCKVCNPITLKR